MNVTGTTRLPNRRDFVVQSTSNYGVEFIQFNGNYDVGAKFTAFLGAPIVTSQKSVAHADAGRAVLISGA